MLEIPRNSIKSKTEEAKQKELESWKQENVYEKIPSEEQETIWTQRLISPKVINYVMSTKADLIARGFEEKKVRQTVQHVCLLESLHVFVSIAVSLSFSGFNIGSFDLKYAFFQGYQIARFIARYLYKTTTRN